MSTLRRMPRAGQRRVSTALAAAPDGAMGTAANDEISAVMDVPAGGLAMDAVAGAADTDPVLVVARSLEGILRGASLPDTLVLLSFDVTDRHSDPATCSDNAIIWDGSQVRGPGVEPVFGPVLGVVLPRDDAGGAAGDAAIAARLLPESLRDDAVFRFAAGEEEALREWCWRRLSLLLRHATQAFARGQLALAALRAREQDLVQALEQVDAAYEHFRVEPCKLALSLAPSGVYLGPASDPAVPVVVRQRVRKRLVNATHVDLFFPRAGTGLSGVLDLNVALSWSRATICESRLGFAAIRAGWNRFRCAGSDPRAGEPLELELRLSGRDAASLLPGLATPCPIAEDCAATDEGSAGRPLALRIWCGIPGLRQPRQLGAHGEPLGEPPADDHAPAGLELTVPADTLALARPHAVPPIAVDFAPLAHDADTQSLLVHPLGVKPTVARLPRLDVAGLTALSVLVSLRNPQAQHTEFAIQVVEATGRMAADRPRWMLLHPGEWGELRHDLARPLSGPVDILLMTRNRTENYQLSWAYFRGLRLWCDGGAPTP